MEEYVELLHKNYEDCCAYLLDKYGAVSDDYFSKVSYERFKKGEIKSLNKKRKISRTKEGLYIHHIDEDKQIKISDKDEILQSDIPFSYQRKDRLVYCNLIEHAILHLLIVKKENLHQKNQKGLGIAGYVVYIRPELVNWLIDENTPALDWQIPCKEVIWMPKEKAEKFIRLLDDFLQMYFPISQKEIERLTAKQLRRFSGYKM